MFKKTSPANYRPDAEDGIVLITDGEPRGKRNTMQLTKQQAQNLKNENVSIVVVGAGRQSENPRFQRTLMDLATSPDYFVISRFDELDDILDKLVTQSCIKSGRLFATV